LAQSYKVLLHHSFVQKAKEVVGKYPQLQGPLVTALLEIQASPMDGAFRYIDDPKLINLVHKIHVGGRKGHRLMYLFISSSKVVIPVFLSDNPKSSFSYDDVDWCTLCRQIFDDYSKRNYSAFQNFQP
jgi:hypothetical protein